MILTKNFTLYEFEFSDWAVRNKVKNSMNKEQINNAILLCENVLQPARDALGPTKMTSGFRSPIVNKAVGGSRTSDHMTGCAGDAELLYGDNWDLLKWIYNNCAFDQLIAEYMEEGDPNAGWVHVSYREKGNRNQVFGYNSALGNYTLPERLL